MGFLLLYNYQKKLKALKYQTPYDTIIQIYQEHPESKSLGLNTLFNSAVGNKITIST